jgi:hypothetical protein
VALGTFMLGKSAMLTEAVEFGPKINWQLTQVTVLFTDTDRPGANGRRVPVGSR